MIRDISVMHKMGVITITINGPNQPAVDYLFNKIETMLGDNPPEENTVDDRFLDRLRGMGLFK